MFWFSIGDILRIIFVRILLRWRMTFLTHSPCRASGVRVIEVPIKVIKLKRVTQGFTARSGLINLAVLFLELWR